MKRVVFVTIVLIGLTIGMAAAQSGTLPYKDSQLPVEQRVQDLLGRMTLEEKLWQLFMVPGQVDAERTKFRHGIFGLQFSTSAAGQGAAQQLLQYGPSGSAAQMAATINAAQRFFIEETRLGIPIIPFDEALHGLVRDGATAFPQSIALAATWDPALMEEIASAIALETRTRGIRQVLSPVVNLATDVRWGRVEESYGEDPLLSALMGAAFVRPFERSGIITTPKHFAANHGEGGRDSYPIHHNQRLLEELYLPPFKACITSGGARSLMIAYNSIDGRPCVANDWLLNHKLKGEWGFTGFVISDAGAVGGMNDLHRVSADYQESIKQAFENGLDVLFQTTVDHFPLFFSRALQGGYIDAAAIDRAVVRVLRAKFALGLFENPYVEPGEAQRCNGQASHLQLAREAARASIVLLKNRGAILPLAPDPGRIALIGPDAAAARLGGYSGPGTAPVSILAGLRARLGEERLRHVTGCRRDSPQATVISGEWLRPTLPAAANEGGSTARSGSAFRSGKAAAKIRKEPPASALHGLKAEYWDNPDLAGAPLLSRTDDRIDFNWTLFSPHPGLAQDWFGVRWSGALVPPFSGTVQIGLEGDDGFRLFIDDSLIIDNWTKGSYHRLLKPVVVHKDVPRRLRVDFCERTGSGRLKLLWDYLPASAGYPNAGDGEAAAEPRPGDAIWRSGVALRDAEGIAAAVAAAQASDIAVVCVGIEEGEANDRASLRLPGAQEELIRQVAAAGKPTVVVITGGSAVTMGDWIDSVDAVLMAWYPGEQGGHAVADVLFGDLNPAGRLPVTFPLAEGQLPLVYNHKPTGRLDYYRDLPGEPLFPFGYGLSYTEFEYSDLAVTEAGIDSFQVCFTIHNTGARSGDEVAQLYIKHPPTLLARPVLELKAFKRLHLEAGARREVTLTLARAQLEALDTELQPALLPGRYTVLIGSSSRDIRLRGALEIRARH